MIIGIMGAMPDEVDQLCAKLENVTVAPYGGVVEVVGFEVAVADDAGADEAALEVAVDLTGSSWPTI